MAIPVVNLAQYVKDPTNEILKGILAAPGYMGKLNEQQQAIQRAKLMNSYQQMVNENAPQTMHDKSDYMRAMIGHQQESAEHERLSNVYQQMVNENEPENLRSIIAGRKRGGVTPKIISTQRGYMAVNPQTNEVTPLSSGGKPIMSTAIGQPGSAPSFMITDDGIKFMPNAAQQAGGLAQGQPQGVGQTGNLAVSPGSPHSRYSTGGQTLIDTGTGKAISTPTKSSVDVLQKVLYGEGSAVPQLISAYNAMQPLLGGGANITSRFLSNVGQRVGITPSEEYSKYVAAENSLKGVAEKLLKSYGLNATGENIQRIQDMITPGKYDSQQTYKFKVANTIAQMINSSSDAKSILKSGYGLSGKTDKITGDSYNNLVGTIAATLGHHSASSNETGDNDRVIVIDKNGARHSLPNSQLGKALSMGYRRG